MIPSQINDLFEEKGPFCQENFTSGEKGRDHFLNSKILVIGAGGLGCEILKSLALTGFKNIDVVDLDTIDVSNLNRQFLFRKKDVGQPKAVVAANFIKSRIPNVNITSHYKDITSKTDDFFKQFTVVIGGLDSLKVRLWISDKLCQIAQSTHGACTIPYIDGGSEEFKGHVKFIIPLKTSCMKCQSFTFPRRTVFQACTVASNPRQPEHCIVWAKEFRWPELRPNEEIDGDKDEDIKWIMKEAKEHAKKFNLDENEINFGLTKGVIKNIIPAIASTQAIIASACVTETLKFVTRAAPNSGAHLAFNGNAVSGISLMNQLINKDKNCLACGYECKKLNVPPNITIKELIDKVKSDLNYSVSSIRTENCTIYMPFIISTKQNLDKLASEFIKKDEIVIATSKETKDYLRFTVDGI